MARRVLAPSWAWIDDAYHQDAAVVVEAGHIEWCGARTDLSASDVDAAETLPGVLLPGLIDAHTHIGLEEEMDPSGSDVNELGNPVQPALRALDGVNPADAGFRDALAEGITTLGILPGSANLIGGTGVSLYPVGSTVERMLVDEGTGLKGALGENPKRDYGSKGKQPFTRMGSMALLRSALYDARAYLHRKDADPDLFDLHAEPLAHLLQKKIPLRLHAHRHDDIASGLRLAREFGFSLVIEHATGAGRILEELHASGAGIALGPLFMTRCKREMHDISFALPARLEQAGIGFCLITDGPELPPSALRLMAMEAKKQGLSERAALASMTTEAARVLGLANRLGAIRSGLEANFCLFDADPLSFEACACQVIIKGETVYERHTTHRQ